MTIKFQEAYIGAATRVPGGAGFFDKTHAAVDLHPEAGDDQKEGSAPFIAKRPPEFTGR